MLVHISTISLSSKSMSDIRLKIEELLEQTKGDGRTYKVGDFYEPVPGYVGVDIEVFLPAQVVQELRAIEEFSSNENKTGIVH